MNNWKLLLIAHNCFSKNKNMGKTLSSYFDIWDSNCIAELYFHSETPTSDLCSNYYRITDTDALKAIILRKSCGKTFSSADIDQERSDPRTDRGALAQVYQYGRKRTPLIYILRNAIWKFSAWNTKTLEQWLDDFNPECIFFASGDYSFSYRIALKLSKERDIPLIVCCMDDYYIHNRNERSWLGRWQHQRFMKVVHATMEQASCIMTINDKMSREYSRLFQKKCYTLYTGAEQKYPPLPDHEKTGISYLGNLGFNRNHQLVEIGRALRSISAPEHPLYLDVYSGEKNPEILKVLTPENGIRFHGAVSADEVNRIIAKSLAVVHTESFDEENKQRVMYSTSTKIAESLASGTCLIAYGPAEVASMEYLIEHNAAVAVTASEQLEEKLKQALMDADFRKRVIGNALRLAEKNHRLEYVAQVVRTAVQEACGKGKE